MRRILIVLPMVLVMMTGCADKFFAARVAVNSGRAAMGMANIGLGVAGKAKKQSCKIPICKKLGEPGTVAYKACMGQDHTADPTWVSCYAKFNNFMTKTWPQAEKTANSGFTTAEASIALAESKKEGLPLDVMPVLKASACFVAEALEFIPPKSREPIQMFLDMMKAFGCTSPPAPATMPTPAPRPSVTPPVARPPAAPPAGVPARP